MASRVPADAGPLVDIGCGDGTFAEYLAARPGRHLGPVIGIDLVSRSFPQPDGSGARYLVGSMAQLPLRDEVAGGAFLVCSVHHAESVTALAEVRRVLRPGGIVVVLGLAASDGLVDLGWELVDLVAHRWHRRGKQSWEPDTARCEPALSWRETRRELLSGLPGATYRRRPMWRYLLTWTKPG